MHIHQRSYIFFLYLQYSFWDLVLTIYQGFSNSAQLILGPREIFFERSSCLLQGVKQHPRPPLITCHLAPPCHSKLSVKNPKLSPYAANVRWGAESPLVKYQLSMKIQFFPYICLMCTCFLLVFLSVFSVFYTRCASLLPLCGRGPQEEWHKHRINSLATLCSGNSVLKKSWLTGNTYFCSYVNKFLRKIGQSMLSNGKGSKKPVSHTSPLYLVEPLASYWNLPLLVWIFRYLHVQVYVLWAQGDKLVYILNCNRNCQIVLGSDPRTCEEVFPP